ncbi:uncharacterized protein BJ171DRAFT_171516 [Polychytrium aggregatum]|uniref:uncharacterized protein n=1 Tax=Polychytrium aggregatum TaxID=110093 RepID=UPI0022FE3C96|nr:uncharacterized protein BJ171DRAFT_254336 [Polychytrium aggregatum]XP_052971003.1 uncharacterized protein BJ171DRAFT_171516 [Polychytrium aggregatum]KAI9193533.1 hypothetical protein BJ171DRAFT_254336 [Polychytrium aggregatum]KAI9208923.1 hypothetical protein BJ171DRAFT_171516 [Polychytrium aggregatum]
MCYVKSIKPSVATPSLPNTGAQFEKPQVSTPSTASFSLATLDSFTPNQSPDVFSFADLNDLNFDNVVLSSEDIKNLDSFFNDPLLTEAVNGDFAWLSPNNSDLCPNDAAPVASLLATQDRAVVADAGKLATVDLSAPSLYPSPPLSVIPTTASMPSDSSDELAFPELITASHVMSSPELNPTAKTSCLASKRPLNSSDCSLSSDDASSLDPVVAKRIKNTEAARRSRQRKIQRLDSLEHQVSLLENDKSQLQIRLAVLENERHSWAAREQEYVSRIQHLEAQLAESHRAMINFGMRGGAIHQ